MASENNEDKLFASILKFNSSGLGLALGVIIGLVIFIATNFLVIKGGHISPNGESIIGPHLQLLGEFFPGYKVSFKGSVIGFLYGFALGTIVGAAIGFIYNQIVRLRN